MARVLVVVVATALLVVFGLQNSDHVPVSFVIGGPTKVRLVFLLAVAAAVGFIVSYIQGLTREIRRLRQPRDRTRISPRDGINTHNTRSAVIRGLGSPYQATTLRA